jgi:uncharacterized protein (DUF1684 family)
LSWTDVLLQPDDQWGAHYNREVEQSARIAALRFVLRLGIAAAIVVSTSCRGGTTKEPERMSVEAAAAETEAWRAKHEADYRREWATIAGLHFLTPGAHTAGSASSNDIVLPASVPPRLGRFVLDNDTVRFEPEPGSAVSLKGTEIETPIQLADDGHDKPDELAIGDIRLVVHRSGDRKSLRVWDPGGVLARGFLGFRWFTIQSEYRVTGRFIPDETAREMQVVNTFGDLDTFKTEGVVEFSLNGQTLRLRPFTTRPKRFYFVFRDASAGQETYEAARFLYSDLREDGTTVLDFNQAYNPPCAFNPYTTCPIPLPENRLKVKILAGERAYPAHPTLPASE